MVQLLALAAEILAIILQVLGVVKEIRGIVDNVVREHIPYFVETAVREVGITLAHPTWGNHAILNAVNAIPTSTATAADLTAARSDILNALGTTEGNILAAVGAPSQAATAPSWWIEPPTPPTPPDEYTIAYAVWSYDSTINRVQPYGYGINAISALGAAASLALYNLGWYGWPLPGNPWIRLCTPYPDGAITSGKNWQGYVSSGEPPYPDFTAWVDGDTPYTFLARTQPTLGWQLAGPGAVNDGHTAWLHGTGSPPYGYWYRSGFEAPYIQTYYTVTNPPEPPVVTINAAPVWPGDAGVTLGTPVALVDQLVVDEVMDGVLIEVTTPPGKLGSYRLGGVTLDYGAGRIAFESDDGQLEMWQYLGFRDAIYTPKTMAHASKARLQVLGGAEGTVTPWTVS